jgi:thiamine pyrophosphokinase
MKSKRVVIISNGEVKNREFFMKLIKKSDYIIAVNGGSKHAKNFGLIPDLIIGDLDSISKEDYVYFQSKGSTFLRYDPIKDKTDVHLAIEHVMKSEFKEILLICVFGDRIDHIIANIFLLLKVVEARIKIKIIDEFNEIILIQNFGKIKGNIGDTVSLIPLTETVTGIQLTGLKYNPKDGRLKMNDTLGISNILTKKVATIQINNGKLLVIKPNKRITKDN